MDSLKVLILLLMSLLVSSENCGQNLTLNINVTVFQDIDSAGENLTANGRIENRKDIFHLLIANETIPKLCQNFVFIQNELSILQIINSSVQEIQPGAFNVTPTLALIRIILNPISTIRKNVFNTIRVKEIDLSQNFITAIETEAFDNNTHLEILKLNNNQIKEINPNWFVNSPKVYKLSAIYNDIKTIPAEAFKNMDQNRPLKLRLSANRITEINPDALNSHHTIELLRINGNKLTTLPENIFINRTIRNLQVNTNHLQCFPDVMFKTGISTLAFVDNVSFECACLRKVKKFAEDNGLDVLYPSIICEDRSREVNIVFNYNKTYEIPLLPPTVDVDVYVKPDQHK
ncbi:LRR 8 domain containing protein [Asbolus verrucosus]|uniref:LRR 8 domain containing protein n=1 Tax=Asbolus verrucosus TaxID=1661398 RepID=A0A482VJD2_ASBVE|nr:LRR 8 domain containing protein [Asbolus verrucosus]